MSDQVDKVIEAHRAVLHLRPPGHSGRIAALNDLAIRLHERFQHRGVISDLDETIELHRVVLLLRPPGHPERIATLNDLAIMLHERFQRRGVQSDLDETIELHRAVLLLRPLGHPERIATLNDLAIMLHERFQRRGVQSDLDETIELHRAVLLLRPLGHPERIATLNDLAIMVHERFRRQGVPSDLDENIELHRAVLLLRPLGHPERIATLNDLAIRVHERFQRRGVPSDLDENIELHRAVLFLRPPGHPERIATLNDLAIRLHERFRKRGTMFDLDETIELHRAVLLLRPTGHPERIATLNDLAIMLHERFQHLGAISDLDEPIGLHRAVLLLRPTGHPERIATLNDLAILLHERFQHLGAIPDLDEPIELHRTVLLLRPPGHPERITTLSDLAIMLHERFQQLGVLSDLDEIIELHQAVLHVSILDSDNAFRACFVSQILSINTITRNACIAGDLSTAERLFTQEINTDANNYTSYANRSFVMARKSHWDNALDDATKSVTIQPSLAGYIAKGISLCGKGQVRDARIAFDIAFMFTNEDSKTIHFLLLVKAITLFSAGQHEEALLLVRELTAACSNNGTLGCRVVEAYLCVQLGIYALNGARHDEAADHFAAAVNSGAFSSKSDIHSTYADLVVLFGWDLKPLWKIANQKRCHALLQAGRLEEALESFQYMMDKSDETTKASCLDWTTAFKGECSTFYLADGDAALAENDYDRAIELYSLAINLNPASDTIFANRSKARSEKMLWEDALLDAQKVIQLNPSSYIGYEVKHAALRGAQRYDEAIEAFKIMLSELYNSPEAQIRELRQQYVSPSAVEDTIRGAVSIELENAPLRLLNTSTGLLCDRAAQINAFKTSAEYKELLSFTTKHADLRMERIKDVVAMYFRCVLLSHRWEETELLLHDIQDKVVYELNALGGIVKLQSFCEVARDAGYYWAWMDTCCIDKNNNAELQESINSMFVWYRHSALTIVYLFDVSPSSQSGALARSAWNKRGWTFQEFVAPKVVLFYRKDWTLYLDDRSRNHKESPAIMEELQDATGIDTRALVSFHPGMRGIREKLQWASTRVTTLQEDIAYSLFGIFGIHLPVIYGEKKQNALGRLLQEIVARSGDITALDWVGQSSEFNSCLPADISSYAAPPCTLPSLSEDEIQTTVSSLRNTVAADLASKYYDQLDNMSSPRFANCRLHLPCVAFRVTEVRRNDGPAQETRFTHGVKADGLHDLLITTEEALNQFTLARSPLQTFLLVRAWDCRLLELPDFEDDTQSEDDFRSAPESPLDELPGGSPVEQEPVDSESHSRALRLIVHLGQPFSAFLLARQRSGEYKRIASDHDIIAQVKDIGSVDSMMDIRTLEIS